MMKRQTIEQWEAALSPRDSRLTLEEATLLELMHLCQGQRTLSEQLTALGRRLERFENRAEEWTAFRLRLEEMLFAPRANGKEVIGG